MYFHQNMYKFPKTRDLNVVNTVTTNSKMQFDRERLVFPDYCHPHRKRAVEGTLEYRLITQCCSSTQVASQLWLHAGITQRLSGPIPTPRDADFISIGYSPGLMILKSSLVDSDRQPSLRLSGLTLHLKMGGLGIRIFLNTQVILIIDIKNMMTNAC